MKLLRLVIVGATLLATAAATNQAQADPAADYNAALKAVQDQYREIEKLYSEYQNADEARQQAINEELKPIVAEARIKVDAMTQAALEVFKANPMADQAITDLLLAVVERQIVGDEKGGADQYEEALPIIEALIEGGHKKAELSVWGVYAAVCTNRFDVADRLAKIAVESGAVSTAPDGSPAARETFAQAVGLLQEKDAMRARWEEEKKIRDAEAEADDLPRVKIKLKQGDIVIELFENEAPIATANFITLVKQGFYDGVPFHRVLARFMAQGGDPTGRGTGGPGYSIACECHQPNARKHFRGTLSMAHAGRNTGGSQFFLCFVPTDFLDGRHTAFGRVAEGIELIGDIQKIDPDNPVARPDTIIKAEVLRDRGHGYEFKKLPER